MIVICLLTTTLLFESILLTVHTTCVPSNSEEMLEISRVDTSGRAPIEEFLVTLSDIVADTIIGDGTLSVVTKRVAEVWFGTVTFHRRVVTLVLHMNANCSPEHTDTSPQGVSTTPYPIPVIHKAYYCHLSKL